MSPAFYTFICALPPLLFLAVHSLWRYAVARTPSPMSIIQAVFPLWLAWFAYRDFSQLAVTTFYPNTSDAFICAFAWTALLVLVLYERQLPEPFDGFFSSKKAVKK